MADAKPEAKPALTRGERKTLTGELGRECSMQSLAVEFGVSRAALAMIEARALRKLRDELHKRGYKLDDLL